MGVGLEREVGPIRKESAISLVVVTPWRAVSWGLDSGHVQGSQGNPPVLDIVEGSLRELEELAIRVFFHSESL